jgi:multiple antibiotic resistance protein
MISLLSAPKIANAMGRARMNVVTRVMRLILASIAVEFIAKGLTELFPVLVKGLPESAKSYRLLPYYKRTVSFII